MLKRVPLALAALGLAIGGVAVAGPAQASTGNTIQMFCTSGGSTFSLIETYDVVNSTVTLRKHTWSSGPAAQFDRITFTILDGAGGTNLMYAMGNASSTQNDVPSSGSSSAENGAFSTIYKPGNPQFRMSVYGGIGNSTATCVSTNPING